MPPRQRPMRFAHAEGHTDVCYSADGKYIITCGADGDVRIWAGIEDDDNVTICVAEEKAIAVAHKEGHLYVGTEDNIVQAYTFPDNKRDGIIARFTAPVTHLSIGSSGTYLASGSCDMEVRVADTKTSNNITLQGHSAPILGVAIDPKEKYVVSSSCDGTIRVWDFKSRRSVKEWDCVPKSNSFFTATVLARPSWQPTNRHYLAIPQERELRLYEPDTWSHVVIFSSPGSPQPFSLTAFSPCGNYVAAVAGGDICVWDVNLHTQLECLKHESGHTITALAWNPKVRGELAYCDVRGQLGTVEDCLPAVGKAIPRSIPAVKEKNEVNTEDILKGFDDDDTFAFGDDDDDDENAISIDKIKSQTLGLDKDDDDADEVRSVASNKSTGYKLSINAQPPFQPSSTPESLQNRYMVWNSVGIVRCFTAHGENSIDIRFHDTAVHHNLHINNIFGHTMAALSRQALVMACPAADESPSKVVCVLLNTWDDTKEWSVSLPNEENAIGIGIGTDWFAVATSSRHVRIFGLAGTQRQVVSLPGPIVCLSGMGDKLMVVFHAGVGLPDEQCLAYQLFTITKESHLTSSLSQLLPITPASTLKWIGFSDENTPCSLDSADMLRMLPRRSAHWMPVCNTHEYCKGVSDHYFIIGVSEQYQNIRAVLCRGAHYPPTSPLPVVNELSLKIPLCEMESEKSKLEESLSRAILLLSSMKAALQSCKDEDLYLVAQESLKDAEKIQNETLMKLFALSARSGLEVRAVELCNLMPTVHLTELAAKYSSKLGRLTLVDRVGKVMTAKREIEEVERPLSPDMFASQTSRNSYSRYCSNNENMDPHEDAVAAGQDVRGASETENLLLAVKRKREALENEVVIKPTILTPGVKKKTNPFKKAHHVNALISGLDAIASSKPESKKKSLSALPGQAVKKPSAGTEKPKSRQMNLFGKRVDDDSAKKNSKDESNKLPPFMLWFSQNKEEFEEEFPDLDSADITKVAMKRYRELGSKNKSPKTAPSNKATESNVPSVDTGKPEESDKPEDSDESERKKRRVEDEPGEEMDLADALTQIEAEEGFSTEENEEPPKEKKEPPKEKKNPPKKSGFSKLSAFAFKKPM